METNLFIILQKHFVDNLPSLNELVVVELMSNGSGENSLSTPISKKRKDGGSYCGASHCSQTSNTVRTSSHPDRHFLRFINYPKTQNSVMVGRLEWGVVQLETFCLYLAEDFIEADVERFKEGIAYQTIRLKPCSLPRTDRATGYMVDPKLPSEKLEWSVS